MKNKQAIGYLGLDHRQVKPGDVHLAIINMQIVAKTMGEWAVTRRGPRTET